MKKKFSAVSLIAMAALLCGLVASPAAAATFTQIPQPDAAYLADTTKIDISGLTEYSTYSSITDGNMTVNFSRPLEKRVVGSSWMSWSSPPWSESATPQILFNDNATADITMTMSKPCRIFGFELEPNPFIDCDYDVDFILLDGVTVVGTISMTVNGSYGARLFAAEAEGATFNKIIIYNRDNADFAIAQVRYETWDGWVTGGANFKTGKKVEWTMGGTVAWDEIGGLAGQIQLNNHTARKSWHFTTITSLAFSGESTESPYSDYNTATFVASGVNKAGQTFVATFVVKDVQEPGKGYDVLSIDTTSGPGPGDIVNRVISGGNFQIHPPETEFEF